MSAQNPTIEPSALFPAIASKSDLIRQIRDAQNNGNPRRWSELVHRLSSTDTSVWPDPLHVDRN